MKEIMLGVFVLVIIAVTAMGFLMIANENELVIENAIADPINNSYIMTNNSAANATANMTSTISDILPTMLFLGMLLLIVIILTKVGGMW